MATLSSPITALLTPTYFFVQQQKIIELISFLLLLYFYCDLFMLFQVISSGLPIFFCLLFSEVNSQTFFQFWEPQNDLSVCHLNDGLNLRFLLLAGVERSSFRLSKIGSVEAKCKRSIKLLFSVALARNRENIIVVPPINFNNFL